MIPPQLTQCLTRAGTTARPAAEPPGSGDPAGTPTARSTQGTRTAQLANSQDPRYHSQAHPTPGAGGWLVGSLGSRAGLKLIQPAGAPGKIRDPAVLCHWTQLLQLL